MYRDREGGMQGINMYVPAMQYAASLAANECNTFSLGKPAVANDAVITASTPTNGGANSVAYFSTPWVSDARYGRPIVVTPLASVTFTGDVLGEDYLGQPVSERFAFSASAAAVTGKKSFYRVLGIKTVVA